MLRRLTDEDGRQMADNYRPIQDLHDRVLFYRSDLGPYSPINLLGHFQSLKAMIMVKEQYLREQFASILGK